MDRNDISVFAETLHDHCNHCKHCKPGWGAAGCKKPDCVFFTIRLLKDRVNRDPREIDRILAYRLTT